MKHLFKIYGAVVLLSITLSSFAQAPNGFNYQSVLRGSTGTILANQAVTLRFSIRTDTSTGTVQYQESQALTTNQYGLVNHVIGTGTVLSGSLSAVTWSDGDKYLEIEVDPGSGFVNLGTDKINSVPYAMFAGSSADASDWELTGNTTSGTDRLGTNNAQPLIFKTNNTDRLTIDANGKIGIGITPTRATLEQNSPITTAAIFGGNSSGVSLAMNYPGIGFNTYFDAGGTRAIGNGFGGSWTYNSSNGDLYYYTSTASASANSVFTTPNRFTILNNGNVGIGTSTPGSKLEIEGTGNVNSTIETTSGGTSESQLDLKSGTTSWRLFSRESDQTFGIYNGTTRFRINAATNQMSLMESGGFVGIGTSAAASRLHVTAPVVSNEYVGRFVNSSTGSTDGIAVYAQATSTATNYGIGIRGAGNYYGVHALSATGGYTALRAEANGASYAGVFTGSVSISGVLSKGSGTFKIDHPADPANKYLVHSFVESPDMMNIYNGNIQTDADGNASIQLPEYFSILNKDFRYQLTVIGSFAHAVVMEEVDEVTNSFKVKSDLPNTKVSWMITGVRKDPFANANRVVDEVEKSADEKGFYLHPELYGESADKQVFNRKETSGKVEINK